MDSVDTNLKAKRRSEISVVFCLIVGLVLFRNAWMCDDAFITLRTVDNFVNGFGLRWNIAERVQSYTHPLWMFVLSTVYAITREPYYTTILISWVVSFAACIILLRKTTCSLTAGLIALALCLSLGFVDFATSGLENPLSYLLLTLFFLRVLPVKPDGRDVLLVSFLVSLLALNRQDAILIVAPPFLCYLLGALRRNAMRWKSILAQTALGFTPLAAWELFSLMYYGFPFPNTAYAKLNTGIPAGEYFHQGFLYFVNAISVDPATVFLILVALYIGGRGERIWKCSAIGIALYLLYIAKVGGDFMGTRFLSLPFISACVLIARAGLDKTLLVSLAVVIAIIGLGNPHAPVFTRFDYKAYKKLDGNGIADEKGCYWRESALANASRHHKMPNHPWVEQGLAYSVERPGNAAEIDGPQPLLDDHVGVEGAVGIIGYYAGPTKHLVDRFALADPLLSRLPIKPGNWRIGHFTREIPEGYLETLNSGTNVIANIGIREYYHRLTPVVMGPLFTWERAREIVRFNLKMNEEYLKAIHLKAGQFHRKTGKKVKNPDTADRTAILADGADGEGFMAFGNYFTLPPGDYQAVFKIKVSGGMGSLLRLDVCSNAGREMLASETITDQMPNSEGEWVHYGVKFTVPGKGGEEASVEARAYFFGNGKVLLGEVQIAGAHLEFTATDIVYF